MCIYVRQTYVHTQICRLSGGKNRQTEDEKEEKNHHRIGLTKLTALAWATVPVSSPGPFHRSYLHIYSYYYYAISIRPDGRTVRGYCCIKSRRTKNPKYDVTRVDEKTPWLYRITLLWRCKTATGDGIAAETCDNILFNELFSSFLLSTSVNVTRNRVGRLMHSYVLVEKHRRALGKFKFMYEKKKKNVLITFWCKWPKNKNCTRVRRTRDNRRNSTRSTNRSVSNRLSRTGAGRSVRCYIFRGQLVVKRNDCFPTENRRSRVRATCAHAFARTPVGFRISKTTRTGSGHGLRSTRVGFRLLTLPRRRHAWRLAIEYVCRNVCSLRLGKTRCLT